MLHALMWGNIRRDERTAPGVGGTKLYLVCLIDDHSRLAWAEVTGDVTSLTVMFAALKCMNILHDQYRLKFEEILSDNGPEFGTKNSKQKEHHPFERMLTELGITHRYTQLYRPQTNGKIERFGEHFRKI